jgi:hypothetical protein
MSVLTEREYMIAIKQIFDGTRAEQKIINEKLKSFQEMLIDQDHVDAINAFIPAAQKAAESAEEKAPPHEKRYAFDRAFHKAMNRSTRKAGLRV